MGHTTMNSQDLAKIANRLQVPVIANHIMDDPAILNDDMHFALHDLLSDMQPDSALLSIALTAKSICQQYITASESMAIMDIECQRVISDYGQLWVQDGKQEAEDALELYDSMSYISEDLEYFIDMLELNIAYLRSKDETAATIFEILLAQTKAHFLIAEEFINALSYATHNDIQERVEHKMNNEMDFALAQQKLDDNQSTSGNIILFPTKRS